MNDFFLLAYCKDIKSALAGNSDQNSVADTTVPFAFDFIVKENNEEAREMLGDSPFFKEVLSTKELSEPFDEIVELVNNLLCLKDIYHIRTSLKCRRSSSIFQNSRPIQNIILNKLKSTELQNKLFQHSDAHIRNILFPEEMKNSEEEFLSPETFKLMTSVTFVAFEEQLKSTAKELGSIPSSFVDKIVPIIEKLVKSGKFPLFYVKDEKPSEHLNFLLTLAENALTDIVNFCAMTFLTFTQHLFMGTNGMLGRELFSLQLVRSRDGFSLDFDPTRMQKRLTGFIQSEYLQCILPTKSIRGFLGRYHNCTKHFFSEPVDDLVHSICHQVDQLCNDIRKEEKMLNEFFLKFSTNSSLDFYDIKYKFGNLTKTVCHGTVTIYLDKMHQWLEREFSKKAAEHRENEKLKEAQCCTVQSWKRLLMKGDNEVAHLHQLVKMEQVEPSVIVSGSFLPNEDELKDAGDNQIDVNSKNSTESPCLVRKGKKLMAPNGNLVHPTVDEISTPPTKNNKCHSKASKQRRKKKVSSKTLLSSSSSSPHVAQSNHEVRAEPHQNSATKKRSNNAPLPSINSVKRLSYSPLSPQDLDKVHSSASAFNTNDVISRNIVVLKPVKLTLSSSHVASRDSIVALNTLPEKGENILSSAKKMIRETPFHSSSSTATRTPITSSTEQVSQQKKNPVKELPLNGVMEAESDKILPEGLTTSIRCSDEDYNNFSSLTHQNSSAPESSSLNLTYDNPGVSPCAVGHACGESRDENAMERTPLFQTASAGTPIFRAPRYGAQTFRSTTMPLNTTPMDEEGRVGDVNSYGRGVDSRVANSCDSGPWWKKSQTESICQQNERKKQLQKLQNPSAITTLIPSHKAASYDTASFCSHSRLRLDTVPFRSRREDATSYEESLDPQAFLETSSDVHCTSFTLQSHDTKNLPHISRAKTSDSTSSSIHFPTIEKSESHRQNAQSFATINNEELNVSPHAPAENSAENAPRLSSIPFPPPLPPQSTSSYSSPAVVNTHSAFTRGFFAHMEQDFCVGVQHTPKVPISLPFSAESSGNAAPLLNSWSSEKNEFIGSPEKETFLDRSTEDIDFVCLYKKECQKNEVEPVSDFLRLIETMRYNLRITTIDFSLLSCNFQDVRPSLSLLTYNKGNLRILNLNDCQLENKHIVELFYYLRWGSVGANLEELYLSYNPITYVGGMSIIRIVKCCPLLRFIHLSGTSIPQRVMREIKALMEERG